MVRARLSGGILCLLAILILMAAPGLSAKNYLFKTCEQSPFCRRNREYADRATAAPAAWAPPYSVDLATVSFETGVLDGTILKSVLDSRGEPTVAELPFSLVFLESGSARLVVDEKRRLGSPIDGFPSRLTQRRYNEASKWAVVGDMTPDISAIDISTDEERSGGIYRIKYGPNHSFEAVFSASPLQIKFLRDGEAHVILNERSLLNVDQWRPKPTVENLAEDPSLANEIDIKDMWEEDFGGKKDMKPKGPEAVAMDITFPGYEHVFGIPEHADKFSLRETRGGEGNHNEPYRLFNVDIFEYDVNSPMAMYGAIPFMQAHRKGSSVAVLWANAAETWIDIVKTRPNPEAFGTRKSTQTHWISESGIIDVYVMLGPNSASVYQQYGSLTGYAPLPPIYALGYHQCRWNYNSEDDVLEVDANFDKHEIPYDCIWLDIEYTENKKYFTWMKPSFPNAEKMMQALDKRKRKLVAIIDPHIKKETGYKVYEGLVKNDLTTKTENGKEYNGWCWPGESAWIDTFNPKAIEYWKDQFKPGKFCGYEHNLLIWNDMNEPSVFNGPEVTAPRDNIHYGNWEERDVHNVYGMTFINATVQALAARQPRQRPFVLTRAFFAGSQRLGAVWTGDNAAKWEYLDIAGPMLLSHSIAGFGFIGADVGGFFGNPTTELLVRWYQAGAFYPFFRGHAHIESKRREPWVFGEPYTSLIKSSIRLRYQLLPSLYTAFHRTSFDGMPIMRPMFLIAPDNEDILDIDDQFFWGETGLLVKPIVQQGALSTEIYLPDDEVYYDYFDSTIYQGLGYHHIEAPLEKIPVLARGGHILVRRDRYRRSATLMSHDPFTLVVHLDNAGNAAGVLYLDDGETTANIRGAYSHRFFMFSSQDNILRSRSMQPSSVNSRSFEKTIDTVRIEKVLLVGFDMDKLKSATSVESFQDKKSWTTEITVEVAANGKASVITVRDPKVLVTGDWSIQF
ncbi:glycosyl hydrolases family 31-domain-containing protein [Limtongia smithiae]|uniref:glycosyl hydrolases family 31-domain-containing protein n=1 Tax=Limtongia smithiae TaxID=1125753 RepID=UPI0034CEE113